jgi:hypothetical protein
MIGPVILGIYRGRLLMAGCLSLLNTGEGSLQSLIPVLLFSSADKNSTFLLPKLVSRTIAFAMVGSEHRIAPHLYVGGSRIPG